MAALDYFLQRTLVDLSLKVICLAATLSLCIEAQSNFLTTEHAKGEVQLPGLSRSLHRDGDISLAAVVIMYKPLKSSGDGQARTCGDLHASFSDGAALSFTEPFLYMLRRRNFSLTATVQDGSQLVTRSLRLGYSVFDQCAGSDGGLLETAGLFHFLAAKKHFCTAGGGNLKSAIRTPKKERVIGVVGPSVEEEKVALAAPISSAYKLVQIATRSTRDDFSCVLHNGEACTEGHDHEYLFRAGSSDTNQAYAIADLIVHFKWTHFAVVAAKDSTSAALLSLFRKRMSEYGLCAAFVLMLDTKEDALEADRLLRRHRRAKVLVMLGGGRDVRLLADTILERSDEIGEDVPRIWIGNDKWGSSRGLFFSEEGKRYRRTMRAVLGLGKRTPARLEGWEWPLTLQSYIKEFSDFILNVTAGDIRKDPYLTSNPFLCHIMEKANGCSGVCPQPTKFGYTKRCSNDARIPETTSSGEHQSEMVEPFTMVATEIFLRSLDKLFLEFVRKFPYLAGESLADEFYKYAYGERLRTAIKTAEVPCSNGKGDCAVFPGKLQEFVPEYHIVAASMKLGKAAWLGFWKADGFRESPTNISMEMDKSLISFGRELFDNDDEKSDLPEFVDASKRIPISSCSTACQPGFGVSLSFPACCHDCVPCGGAHVSLGGFSRCQPCNAGSRPNVNHTVCQALPIVFISSSVRIGVFVASVAMIIVLGTTLAVVVFFRKTALIRSSDPFLMITLLIAMIAGFLGGSIHLIHPSAAACIVMRLLDTSSLLSSTVVLLVKTSRLARIQFMSRSFRRVRSSWSMMNPAQLSIAACLFIVGILIEVGFLISSPVKKGFRYTNTRTYEVCIIPSWLIISMDSYIILLILVTAVLAFFIRKLPLNYNEAHLLFLTSFSQCVLWGILRPTYYLSLREDRNFLGILLVMMHMTAIWLWLCVPRLYAIIFRPHRRNQRRSTVSTLRFSISIRMASGRRSTAAY